MLRCIVWAFLVRRCRCLAIPENLTGMLALFFISDRQYNINITFTTMKKGVLILLLSMSVCTYAQVQMSTPASEIISEFSDEKYKLESSYNEDSVFTIVFETERATIIHRFDEDTISDAAIVNPNDQLALNFYVQLYNNEYVTVSDTEWKMYTMNGGIASIYLRYDEEGSYFLWKLSESWEPSE